MSTVDPLEAALGGDQPEPSGNEPGGNSNGAAEPTQHPVLTRFGGDVQKALDAYQQLDSTFGQEGHRLGQQVADLEAQIAALQQPEPAEPSQQQNGTNLPNMTIDQLQEWMEENPTQATAYLVAQGQQMLLDQVTEMLDQRLAPVEVTIGRSAAQTVVDGLNKALGPEVVARNQPALVALRKSDPKLFEGDPQLVFQRMKAAVLAADLESGQRGASNGAATTPDVAVMGGSQGRNPQAAEDADNPAAEFLAEMMQAGGETDIFGNPKRTR